MRLDGYVRVSQVRGRGGDSFISPAVQRERIEAWAAAYGHTIGQVFEELDQSGARADRPLLAEALARVERGESDGIIVAKLDRFGRTLIDGLRHIERIQQAGGTFVSVADGFDLTTDTGRLVLRIMLSLAEFELDRVRSNWSDAKARAVARGIHPSATAPFGYRREKTIGPGGRERETGPLLIDTATGPLVTELFKRRAAGAGYTELGRWLEQQGARTGWGRTAWGHRAVKDLIRNDVYLGIASAGEHRNEDAHDPLTDPATFHQAQQPGQQFVARGDREPSIVAPLMRCAACRYRMRTERRQRAKGEVMLFSCRSGASRSWRCEEPAHVSSHDRAVEQWVVERYFAGLRSIAVAHREDAPDVDAILTRRDEQLAAFEAWRDDSRIQQRLGMDAYLAGLESRQDDLNATLAELAKIDSRRHVTMLDVEQLRAIWDTLPTDEQREHLQAAIQCVFVRSASRHGPSLDQRLHVVWASEPVDLPSRGDRAFTPHRFAFPDERDTDIAPVGM